MTNPSQPVVLCTPDFLIEEYVRNNWALRLEKCAPERIDKIKTFEEGERAYHKRILSHHFENGVHIADTFTYFYHGGGSKMKKTMLLINGIRHKAA
jgi:hypothetical protein